MSTASAIDELPTSRSDLFAFQVRGRIHQPDIERMARTLLEAFHELSEVDILILIRKWVGIDLQAAFDPKALWAQALSNRHVRRYGVVGAPLWAKAMINLFSPLTPIEERTFDLTEEAEAWGWIGGRYAAD